MNRDRERYDAERGHRQEDQDQGDRSPNFQNTRSQRWQSAGGHRAGNRDWHHEREQAIPDGDEQPYGVGAEAAYGVPADDRYFSRRYGTHIPEEPRHRNIMRDERTDFDHQSDWEMQRRGHFPKPGYRAPVSGQISQGGFWAADLDGPHRGPVTGDELRGRGHFLDHDYVSWREEQLRSHDRDYNEWREERRRGYDAEYDNWRRERQDKFGQDFSDWRTQRTTTAPDSEATGDAQRRNPLTASRQAETDKKKHDT